MRDLITDLRSIEEDERVDFHARGTAERAADEIVRLRADLVTYGKDTVATENRIIDAEFAAQELRTVLQEILDGFGLHHLSKFCRDKAASALSPQQGGGAA